MVVIPNPSTQRKRLPPRRSAVTIDLEQDGSRYVLTVGYFPDGSVGELFLSHGRSNSLLDSLASDAAILASLALQFGCPLDTLRHALKRDSSGTAASPIGQALDLLAEMAP